MFDLKTLVRELAEALNAIYEPDGSGFAIEVPLSHDRYQSVTVFAEDDAIELITMVHELDKAARSTIDKFQKRAKHCKITLDADPADGVYHAAVRAIVPLDDAKPEKLRPLIVEVAELGDGIEGELTGGDVD